MEIESDISPNQLNLADLNNDVLNEIFRFVSCKYLKKLKIVNKLFKDLVLEYFYSKCKFNCLKIRDFHNNDRIRYIYNVNSLTDLDKFNNLIGVEDINYFPRKNFIFPKNLKYITFDNNFNDSIIPGILPDGLTNLIFIGNYNTEIEKNVLPKSLTSLEFGYNFDRPIKEGVLPKNLTKLKFGYKFNQPIDINVLPNSLTILKFGSNFNQTLGPGVLPNSLTNLEIIESFTGRIIKKIN